MRETKRKPAGGRASEGTYYSDIHGGYRITYEVKLLAIVEPEASPTGKAQLIFFVGAIGPNHARVFTAPVTCYLSLGAFSRMCCGHGVFMAKDEVKRIYREALALIDSGNLPRLDTGSDVETFLRKANAICHTGESI